MSRYEEVLEDGRVPRSKGSKVQGSQSPKDQDISNSKSSTSLTLKKVHLVNVVIICHTSLIAIECLYALL